MISPHLSEDLLEFSFCRELRCILKEYTFPSPPSPWNPVYTAAFLFHQVRATPFVTFELFSISLTAQDKPINFHMGKLLHHSSRTPFIHCSSQMYFYLTTPIEESDLTTWEIFWESLDTDHFLTNTGKLPHGFISSTTQYLHGLLKQICSSRFQVIMPTSSWCI